MPGPSRKWLDNVGDRIRSRRRRRLVHGYSATVLLKVVPLVAACVVLVQMLLPLVRGAEVPRSTGDYNLAVAQFRNDVQDDLPRSVADEVQTFVPAVVKGVPKALQQSAETQGNRALLRIEVGELPVAVAGSRPEEQPSAARNLPSDSNADALLFGSISNDGAAVVVTAFLWLSPRALPRAEELSGIHRIQMAREDMSRPDGAIPLCGPVEVVEGGLERLLGRAAAVVAPHQLLGEAVPEREWPAPGRRPGATALAGRARELVARGHADGSRTS